MSTARRPALFLDRDGVINVDRGYVHRREDFEFHPGIFALCRAAQALGYLVVVVTNQAGIARGYYTEAAFVELTDWMIRAFSDAHVSIARVYYCPYHPVHGIAGYKLDSADRKPRPGMLLRAQADLDLDLSGSILVGDTLSDIDAAIAAGVGTRILVHSSAAPPAQGRRHAGDYARCTSLDEVRHTFFSQRLHAERTS